MCVCVCVCVSFFNCILTFVNYLMLEPFLLKNNSDPLSLSAIHYRNDTTQSLTPDVGGSANLCTIFAMNGMCEIDI